MRFDLLPAAHCRELSKLLNDVKPFQYEDVRDIIRQELGNDPESIFLEFDPTPFALHLSGRCIGRSCPLGGGSRSRSNGRRHASFSRPTSS